jgi:hypothetical protein
VRLPSRWGPNEPGLAHPGPVVPGRFADPAHGDGARVGEAGGAGGRDAPSGHSTLADTARIRRHTTLSRWPTAARKDI